VTTLCILVVLTLTGGAAPAAETYRSAIVNGSGALEILTSEGKRIVVSKQKDQTAFRDPQISPDGHAVGAQADYPNCCTSYDIPLALVVYAGGKAHRFTGSGLPIFTWRFDGEGARVAYGQQTVHASCGIHYELRDIASERLLDSADVPEDFPNCPAVGGAKVRIPEWVAKLRPAEPK